MTQNVTRQTGKRDNATQRYNQNKLILETVIHPRPVNEIRFHFHLCVTEIPADLRIVHCLRQH